MQFKLYCFLIVGVAVATPCLDQSGVNSTQYDDKNRIYNGSQVVIELYFESLCPYSRKFIVSELFPPWIVLNDTGIMSIELIPYGNAHEVRNSDGSWKFTCQHGNAECKINIAEACIMDRTKQDVQRYFPVIACIEDSEDPIEAIEGCIYYESNDLNFEDIVTCAQGPEENRLYHELALKTAALCPVHEDVPWILINGQHSRQIQHEARTNLLKLVCKLYEGEKPIVCSEGLF